MTTIERIFNEVKSKVEKNPKAEFYLHDTTLSQMLKEAVPIPTKGKIDLFFSGENVINLEFELSKESFTKKLHNGVGVSAFARIVWVHGDGLEYSADEYPNYNGTVL